MPAAGGAADGRQRICAAGHVRAEKRGERGAGFDVGVWDTPHKRMACHHTFDARELSATEYRWFTVGTLLPATGQFLYLAPVNNAAIVTALFTDRIMLLPANALARLEAVPVHPQWRNSLQPVGTPGPALTLAVQGKTGYRILLPARPTTQEQKAADDLASWLREITGADFPTIKEGSPEAGTTGPVISVGKTLLAGNNLAAPLGPEGYAIDVRGKNLLLAGGATRGIINAVYALLEEDLGCRWFTRDTRTLPERSTLTFRPVPRHFTPALSQRDPYYWDAFDSAWSLRNRTNSPCAPVPKEWAGI